MYVRAVAALAAFSAVASLQADVVVDYTLDAGGSNDQPLNGLAARATYSLDGLDLTVRLENISTGVPIDFGASDSLLVSLGFNLPDNIFITEGLAAVIGAGGTGLGAWSGLGAGDDVSQQWAWSNDGAGDVLDAYRQVLTTSNGQGSGDHMRFDGVLNGNVGGPWGGVAAMPPILDLPGTQQAIGGAVEFTVRLSEMLNPGALEEVAAGGIVEFGSDRQYLTVVPSPAVAAVLALAGLASGSRRRRGHSA